MSDYKSLISGFAAALALAGVGLSATPASAQGFFDALFGRRPSPPSYSNYYSYADPRGYYDRGYYSRGYYDRGYYNRDGYEDDEGHRSSSGGQLGSSASYCVRLCDGRYFPVPRGSANAAQTCQSLCPTANTKVFSGSGVAHDGKHYSDLDTAYLYRQKLVQDCTCNGKDALGLSRIDLAEDRTLREGDIVATTDGLMSYRSRRGHATFTPVDPKTLTKAWRDNLANLKIEPEPELPPTDAMTPQDARKAAERRNAQR